MKTARTTFFTRDKNFYKTFFWLMLVVALQNLVAYSVNMLDNIMLGSYSQNALSGAATVNQIFFIVNQLALSIGNALVAICSQYWGKQETEEIRKLTGAALALSILIAAVVVTACTCMPERLLGIFTTSPEIIAEGKAYLGPLKWTPLLFLSSEDFICHISSVIDHKWLYQLHIDFWTFWISGDGDQGSSSGNVNCKNAGTIDHCGVCVEDRYESPVI